MAWLASLVSKFLGMVVPLLLNWTVGFVTTLVTNWLEKRKADKKIDESTKKASEGDLKDRLNGGQELEDQINGNV